MPPNGKKPTGKSPERLKIAGDWTQAVEKSMKRAKPEAGWPKPAPRAKPKKSKK